MPPALSDGMDLARRLAAPGRDWDADPEGEVRLAVVGLGNYARSVSIPAIEAAEYCAFTVGVSGTPATREAVAEEYGVETIDYEAYADGAASGAYDAVYVATPNRLHLPHAETAADLGKDVLCEKPLEATVERAERLVEACEAAGVTLMTAYRMQADPVVRALRRAIADGALGTVTRATGGFTFDVLGGTRGPDQWRLDEDLAGGGALMDVGVYPLNTARYLLDADPVAVRGQIRSTPPFDAVDEHVDFEVEFPACVGQFNASFSGQSDARLAVYGTEGIVELRRAFQPRADRRVIVETDDGRAVLEGRGADETREEFAYFGHCLLTDRHPEPDGQDGLADLAAMTAVYEAAATGEQVRL